MPWAYTQPGNWKTTRKRILERDGHRCTTPGCGAPATEVDHIVPVTQGGSHHDDNLASLCSTHHDAKSKRERAAARHAVSRRRAPEQHPGR